MVVFWSFWGFFVVVCGRFWVCGRDPSCTQLFWYIWWYFLLKYLLTLNFFWPATAGIKVYTSIRLFRATTVIWYALLYHLDPWGAGWGGVGEARDTLERRTQELP